MSNSEIDRKQIKMLQARFQALSNTRLERMLASFSLSQSDAVQLIPLLFHVNHPMLPGYVDKQTPSGIPNYSPSNLEKQIAKTVSRSFKYQTKAYLRYEIIGLYLMGSAGTLGQSIRSDLDLWICIANDMSKSSREKLQKKADGVSQWMATRNIEVNFYLVGENDFKGNISKHLSKESCGDTQNFLLLDEFYRTAIWLCGRTPLWWVIPPEADYKTYAARLINEKHLDWADWIDFGHVEEIPASEYFSASLWQLYKSIESPYKSLLKLLLLEVYARHVNDTGLLSHQFKQQVYLNDPNKQFVDPYLSMFEYADQFIQEQPQRREFLRRAFYLKSGTKVQLNNLKPVGWRSRQLLDLVKSWGWNQERLDYLNQRNQWQINRVLKERVELVRELNHSYHFLSSFARVKGVADQVSQNELLSLGRKLYSVFEKRPGKVELINTGIVNDLFETSVTIFQKGEAEWQLFLGAVNQEKIKISQPIYQVESLFMLLAWSVSNKITTPQTRFQIFSDSSFNTPNFVQSIVRNLAKLQVTRESVVNDEVFQHPAMTTKIGVFFNTQQDPLAEEKAAGVFSVASRLDHFCWGERKINLVPQFETFTSNSWGENICKQYCGEDAWVQFYLDNREILNEVEEKVVLFFDNLPQPEKLKERLFDLLNRWSRLWNNHLKHQIQYRYFMTQGSGYLRIDFDGKGVVTEAFSDLESLLHSLAMPSEGDFKYSLDEEILLPDPIKKIIERKVDDKVNVFYLQTSPQTIEVFIKDISGQIYYQKHSGSFPNQLMKYYQQFMDAINRSISFLSNEANYYEFWFLDLQTKPCVIRFNRVKTQQSTISGDFWRVKAIACLNSEGDVCFDLALANELFQYQDYGELVYRNLAKLILSKRQTSNRYPVFITDIDLSAVNQSPALSHYFHYKGNIENKLLKALEKLVVR